MDIGLFSYSAHPKNEFNPGIENLTYNLAQTLSEKHTVHVFESVLGHHESACSGIDVHRSKPITEFGGLSINQFSFARRVISDHRNLIQTLDILHDIGSYIPFFTRKIDAPTITTFHHYQSPSSLKEYIEMFPEPLVLHKETFADSVVGVSPFAAEQVTQFFGVKDVSIVPNGVDLEFYNPQQKNSPRQGSLELLYVGGLVERKNVATLLRAIPILIENADRRVHLTVVGKGPLEEELHLLVDELDIEPNVTFTGHISGTELRSQYHNANFFVFPSLLEGFGMVTVEAMACGTPVLTSNISPLNDIVGEGGLLFEPTDADAIASTVLTATEKDYSKLSREARTQAEKFGWDRVAEKYVEVYSNAISES